MVSLSNEFTGKSCLRCAANAVTFVAVAWGLRAVLAPATSAAHVAGFSRVIGKARLSNRHPRKPTQWLTFQRLSVTPTASWGWNSERRNGTTGPDQRSAVSQGLALKTRWHTLGPGIA
jgi:hypothetical protein